MIIVPRLHCLSDFRRNAVERKKGIVVLRVLRRTARRDVKFINTDDIPTTVLNVITPSASIMVNGFPGFGGTRETQDGACARIYLQSLYGG